MNLRSLSPRSVALAVMLTVCAVQASSASSLIAGRKKVDLRIRFIARSSPFQRSSFSNNMDFFLAEVTLKGQKPRLAKIVYEFMYYEPELDPADLDFNTQFRFTGERNTKCDQSANSFVNASRAHRPTSAPEPLFFTNGAPSGEGNLSGNLPCFVISPRGFRGLQRLKVPSSYVDD